MRYALYILMVVFLCSPSQLSQAYSKKNKVYESDVRSLLFYIYKAQTAKSSTKRQAQLQQANSLLPKTLKKLSPSQKQLIKTKLNALGQASPSDFENLVTLIVKTLQLDAAPVSHPVRSAGKKHYSQYCAHCHGPQGTPPPAIKTRLAHIPDNFTQDYMSAFRCYNQLIVGDKESGKENIAALLSIRDLWSVCFYTLSMQQIDRSPTAKQQQSSCTWTLEKLALSTEQDLKKLAKTCKLSVAQIKSLAFERSVPRK